MPAANAMESPQPPALQVPEPRGAPEGGPAWSSSSTPTLRRRRLQMRRTRNVREPSLEAALAPDLPGALGPGKEFLQLPSIEITPSSDEDTPWSNCSTPSASPRRKRFLLRKWLRVRERKECSESSSQQSSQQSSHDDDSSRFLSPRGREERPSGDDGAGRCGDSKARPVTPTAARRPAPPFSGSGPARPPLRTRTETRWWRRVRTTPRTSPRPPPSKACNAAAPPSPAGVGAKIPRKARAGTMY
ncbi:protein Aster-B isoform X8 [Dipodomys spectabilis]|uniref:protein Aster-B isoform X8 n=1 Tax=Dipodomys spectabilis TaxID=105255 RepID=UPI001C5379F8|nr:protein Aster-B isoform X8 [Dipodomys spectabilis]